MANLSADTKIENSSLANGNLKALPTNIEGLQSMQACWMREMLAFNTDAMEFVHKRLQHDIDTSAELMGCRTSTEAATLMARFYERTIFDYSSQATRMFDMTRSLMRSLSEASMPEKNEMSGTEQVATPASSNEAEASNACETQIVVVEAGEIEQRASPAG